MQACDQPTDDIRLYVAGELPDASRRLLSAHVATCAACARDVARERRLIGLLAGLPAVPEFDVAVPALPARRLITTRRLAVAVALAAAASLLVALRLLAPAASTPVGDDPLGVAEVPIRRGSPVHIRHVVDAAERAPPTADGLLAITAGVEAVVMRRPTLPR